MTSKIRKEQIVNIAKAVIAEQLGILMSDITMESSVYDLGGDSLDAVEIVMALEEEFETEVTDETSESWVSFASVCAFFFQAKNVKVNNETYDRALRAEKKRVRVSPNVDAEIHALTPLSSVMHASYMTRAVEEFVCKHTEMLSGGADALYDHIKMECGQSAALQIVMSGRVCEEDLHDIVNLLQQAEYVFINATENVVKDEQGELTLLVKTVIQFGLPTYEGRV